jgi:uncharacterized protein
MMQTVRWLMFFAVLGVALLSVGCALQRKLLFQPSHRPISNGLADWSIDGVSVGSARLVEHPANVWLFTHGNAGQAADRSYALPCFAANDAVFILEYPGYGLRPGSPSKKSLNAAAQQAYRWLRTRYPGTPVCAAGESIGSGPASSLAGLEPAPDKIVLVVPFDNLASVVSDHLPLFPHFALADRWDNVAALKGYRGKLELFAAVQDRIIPFYHARNLAESLPGAVLHELPGGHNDWSRTGLVRIRN